MKSALTLIRTRWKALLLIGVLASFSSLLVFLPIDWEKIGNWGYAGTFLVTLLGSIGLGGVPGISMFAVGLAGMNLNPIGVGIAAGLGSTLGEQTAYAAGAAGRNDLAKIKGYDFFVRYLQNYMALVIFAGAAFPNPFFDGIGILAGGFKYPWLKFSIACFVGKSVKFTMIASSVFVAQELCDLLPPTCEFIRASLR